MRVRVPPVGMAPRLLVAFAALILLLVVYSAWSYRQSRDRQRGAVAEETVRTAETTAALVHGLLRDLDSASLAMATALATSPGPLDQAHIGSFLSAVGARYPFVRSLFLIDTTGRVSATMTGSSLGYDLSGRPYTKALLSGQDVILTDVLAGSETGEPIITLARRVTADDGSLRALLAVAFYPDRITSVFPQAIPADAQVEVYDRRGWIIYSSAAPDLPWERRDQSGSLPVRKALAGEGTLLPHTVSPIDGQERVGAIVPVPEYGWVVGLSRPTAVLEQPLGDFFRRQTVALVAVAALAGLLAIVFTRELTRPLRRLAAQARAFGRGETVTPWPERGPLEVRTLAAALSQMEQQVRQRLAEREEALAEARSALAIRDGFLSLASHELRTPLTILKGQIQLAQRRLVRGSTGGEVGLAFARAEEHVNRLTLLVQDLLDVSRIASGRLEVNLAPGDLIAVVRRAVEVERTADPSRTVTLVVADSLPAVLMDQGRVEQVLVNLLENARKYSPVGAPVEVWVRAEGGHVLVQVRDEGIGIAPEEQARIFERFQRGSNVDRNVAGLGLGLYIAGEIARAHEGTLTVGSAPGAGSTFTLSLPVVEVATGGAPSERPARPAAGDGSVAEAAN